MYTYIACKLETVNYLRSFHIALWWFFLVIAVIAVADQADVAFGVILSENISREPRGNHISLAAPMEITIKKTKPNQTKKINDIFHFVSIGIQHIFTN